MHLTPACWSKPVTVEELAWMGRTGTSRLQRVLPHTRPGPLCGEQILCEGPRLCQPLEFITQFLFNLPPEPRATAQLLLEILNGQWWELLSL